MDGAGRTTIFHSSQLKCKSPPPPLAVTQPAAAQPQQSQQQQQQPAHNNGLPSAAMLKPVSKSSPRTPVSSNGNSNGETPQFPSRALLRPTPGSVLLRDMPHASPPLRNKCSSLADLLDADQNHQQQQQHQQHQQQYQLQPSSGAPASTPGQPRGQVKKPFENGMKKASSTLSLITPPLQLAPTPTPTPAASVSVSDASVAEHSSSSSSSSDSDYETICTVSTYKEDKVVKTLRPVSQAAADSTSTSSTTSTTPSPPPPPPPVCTTVSSPPPPPPLPKSFDIRSTESTLRRPLPSALSASGENCRSDTSSNADTDDSASSTGTAHSEERTLPRLFERPMSFIPPQFMQPPDSDTNLKPSEYLKTVSNKPKSLLLNKEFKVESTASKKHLGRVIDSPHTPPTQGVTSPHSLTLPSNGSVGNVAKALNGLSGIGGGQHNGVNGHSAGYNGLSGLNGTKVGNGSLSGGSVSSGSVNGDESPTPSLCDEKIHSSSSPANGDVSSNCSTNSLPRSIPSTPCSPQPNGGAFSITKEQLQNVQLKRTDKPSTLERCVLLQKSPCSTLAEQKSTIIEELKQSIGTQGVHGVRKLKEERQRLEEEKEKKKAEELLQQIKATNFVDTIPEKDNNGCVIPAWKRQMLAKKAAEKARKEAEEALQREAEAKKWTSVPVWKRQLLMKNGEATLPGHRTLGPKPLTGTLSCPATPVSSAPSSTTSTPASTPVKSENCSSNGSTNGSSSSSEPPSPATNSASSLVIAEEDKPQNPFLQHGLRKVNVRLQ